MSSFRALFSTLHPITLRREKIADWGDCSLGTRSGKPVIVVRVNSTLPVEMQLLVLLHELAHAVQFRHDEAEELRESDHDAEWGIAYARIWRALMGS